MASGINGDIHRPRTLRVQAILLTAAAVTAWAALGIAVWAPLPERAMDALVPVAPTLTLLAAMCWITGGNRSRDDRRAGRYERREDAYLDTIESFTRPPARRATGPLRRVQ